MSGMMSIHVTTSPLHTVMTGQYEQAMLQGAVKKRISIFEYLQKTYADPLEARKADEGTASHETGEFWCDMVLCTREEFEKMYAESKGIQKKTMNYMILGMSVAGLLDLQVNVQDYLKAFNQLLHEYEYHSTHEPGSLSGKPKMRNFFKPVKGAPTKGNADLSFSGDVTANPSNYAYLNPVNMPFEADFLQTFVALLAIIVEAYQRILTLSTSPSECTQALLAAYSKVDEKIRKNVLSWVVKEVDDFCRAELQSEIENLERLVAITGPS